MERSRKLRATSRPPSELTASVNAGNGAGSSDDEDYEANVMGLPTAPQEVAYPAHCVLRQLVAVLQVPSAPVPQRASTRRQPKVDFSKLDVGSFGPGLSSLVLFGAERVYS